MEQPTLKLDHGIYTILLMDVHGEYAIPIPEHLKFKIRESDAWDGNRLEDMLLASGAPEEDIDPFKLKVLEGLIKGQWSQYNHNLDEDLEEVSQCRIIALSIREGEYEPMQNVKGLHAAWVKDIIGSATELGGDDDSFDYFPGYVRMFLNFCQITGLDSNYCLRALKAVDGLREYNDGNETSWEEWGFIIDEEEDSEEDE